MATLISILKSPLPKEFLKDGAVYKISNIVNGNYYIGCAKYSRERIQMHFNSLKKGNHISKEMQLEFNEHGEHNFFVEILHGYYSWDENKEMKLIEANIIKREQPKYNAVGTQKHIEFLQELRSRKIKNKMKLSEEAIQAIKNKNRVKSILALEFDVTEQTIRRWIDANDAILTTANALAIIKAETGLKQKEILQ
jgi:group I intron endonuclease